MRLHLLLAGVFVFSLFMFGCKKQEKKGQESAVKTETGKQEEGAVTDQGEQPRLDVGKLQSAYDADIEWSNLELLAQKGDTAKINQIAKKYHFDNGLELLDYVELAILGGWQLIQQPEKKEAFKEAYGEQALSVITDPNNQEKVKKFAAKKQAEQQKARPQK